jgi:O-acetyl-ADP-ribose deacetylase (regulator of RNase III)
MNKVLREHVFSSSGRIQVVQGDITEESVDAIVNAANAHLAHGAGVAGAIVRRGGAVIQAESMKWVKEHGPVTHAEPAYTPAGELPCRYVIHAVGPVWGEGQEEQKLRSAIDGCLRLAERLKLESIALPAISTGIFGFPKEIAARVILSAISQYFESNPGSSVKLVRAVLYDPPTVQAFLEIWEQDDHLSA